MGQKYLIDTNVISHLFADRLPEIGKQFLADVINNDFVISVAVEIEVLTYHETPEKMPLIEEFMQLATVLPLDKEVTKKAIELRRNYRKMKLGDAIIGATVLVHNRILITNNTKDFVNIKGLKLIDLHNI
jgi:predicted nucleic acid-binding protein